MRNEICLFVFIVTFVVLMMSIMFFILIGLVCAFSAFKNGELFFPWWEMCRLAIKLGVGGGGVCAIGIWYVYRSNMQRNR